MQTFTDCIIRAAKSEQDFSTRQIAILMILEQTEDEYDRQIHTLATLLGFKRPVISRTGDRLVEAGFVSRSSIPGDKRTCVLTITKAGVRFVQHVLGEGVTAKSKRVPVAA